MAESEQFSAETCADAFRRHYTNYELNIRPQTSQQMHEVHDVVIPGSYIINLFRFGPKTNERSMIETVEGVDLKVVLKALRIFGNSVQKIHLRNVKPVEAEKITQYVKQYCTRSSLELH